LVIARIELQRASEGRPLDDVIVHAHDASVTAAVLDIVSARSRSLPAIIVSAEATGSGGDEQFR
jgi:hypothetical protein